MRYIDIHTHTWYEDKDALLLLNVFAHEPNKLELPGYKSVGLHPWHVEEVEWKKQVVAVEHLAGDPNVIAIGEAGLDKTIAAGYELQNTVFTAQLEIAEKWNKPMVIHCVRSYSEMLALRKRSRQSVPWIFHWYNADLQTARELIRKNCFLSFGHMLFNEKSKAFSAFPEIPSDRIFFETDDAGYTIRQVYEKAASLRKIDLPVLQDQIMDNFARCFQKY